MKVEYFQDGELIVEPCKRIEFASHAGDVIITFSDNKADYLIIDRENFIMAYEE